jgi:uncharacterized protein (TIGR02246 family)
MGESSGSPSERTTRQDDADAIRRLLHAYGDAVLARDALEWGGLWTDDATWELGPDRVLHGRDAIVEHWVAAMAKYRRVVQVYLSSTATIDGDHGTGRAYFIELNERVEGDRLTLVAWYDDIYRRATDGWLFSSRSIRPLYRGAPDLSGMFFGPAD